MLHKLYALVNSACCDDNPDALTSHEILLPGHFLCKFLREKLEDCLDALKEQVRVGSTLYSEHMLAMFPFIIACPCTSAHTARSHCTHTHTRVLTMPRAPQRTPHTARTRCGAARR